MPSSLNGTGVTFNDGTTLQSGNIPAANMGSGTANSSTFLRGDRTWQTVSSGIAAQNCSYSGSLVEVGPVITTRPASAQTLDIGSNRVLTGVRLTDSSDGYTSWRSMFLRGHNIKNTL